MLITLDIENTPEGEVGELAYIDLPPQKVFNHIMVTVEGGEFLEETWGSDNVTRTVTRRPVTRYPVNHTQATEYYYYSLKYRSRDYLPIGLGIRANGGIACLRGEGGVDAFRIADHEFSIFFVNTEPVALTLISWDYFTERKTAVDILSGEGAVPGQRRGAVTKLTFRVYIN